MTATHQVTAEDGTTLHVESTGSGVPILFIHEFAGDHRSWEPQVRAFSRLHRCIVYAARGYPPSQVPADAESYSQDHSVSDAICVLDGLDIARAHIVGLSMGGFSAFHLTLTQPKRVISTAIGGVGYGAGHGTRDAFREECESIARSFESDGAVAVSKRYALGPARVQFQNKDPRGHAEFTRMLGEHSDVGSAGTMRGFQKSRPSLYDFQEEMGDIATPFLIMVGDEDEGAIGPSMMMKNQIPSSGLMMFPKTGHTLNLEEPQLFNAILGGFLAAAEAGRWEQRDPRSMGLNTLGMSDDARPDTVDAPTHE